MTAERPSGVGRPPNGELAGVIVAVKWDPTKIMRLHSVTGRGVDDPSFLNDILRMFENAACGGSDREIAKTVRDMLFTP